MLMNCLIIWKIENCLRHDRDFSCDPQTSTFQYRSFFGLHSRAYTDHAGRTSQAANQLVMMLNELRLSRCRLIRKYIENDTWADSEAVMGKLLDKTELSVIESLACLLHSWSPQQNTYIRSTSNFLFPRHSALFLNCRSKVSSARAHA